MQIFFHIGFPKAASTTLQKQLFANHPQLVNLGLYPTSNVGNDNFKFSGKENLNRINYLDDQRISRLYKLLVQPNGLEFECETVKSLWDQLRFHYSNTDVCFDTSSRIVLSHEAVTSCRFAHPETIEKFRRLRDVFGKVRIILIVRNQLAMLKSLYRDHPFDPRTLECRRRPVSFSEWLDIDIQRGALSLSKSLYFGKVSKVLFNMFGKENVLVLPMEWLQSDLRLFSQMISCFLDINQDITYSLLDKPPINTGVSAFGDHYRSIRSRLLPLLGSLPSLKNLFLPLDTALYKYFKNIGPVSSLVLKDSQLKLLDKMYADDNRRLSVYTGLDLKNLSYFS